MDSKKSLHPVQRHAGTKPIFEALKQDDFDTVRSTCTYGACTLACFSASGGGKVALMGEMQAEEDEGHEAAAALSQTRAYYFVFGVNVEIYYFLEEFGVRIFWYWDVGRLGD